MTDSPWYLKNYQEQFSAKAERRVLGSIEHVLAQEMKERNSFRDTKHLHPSDLAKNDWCPRRTYMSITDTEVSDPQYFSLARMNIFAEGHSIHGKWQKWMWETGNLVGNWGCNKCGHRWMGKSPQLCPQCVSTDIKYREVPIYNDEHHIIGHADGEWEDDRGRALIEIKSVGLGTIRWDAPKLYEGYKTGDIDLEGLWKKIKRPLLPHRRQINLYMYCRKIDHAIVIYEFKANQDVKEFHLTLDMEIVQPMLDGAKQVLQALEDGVMPDRPERARKSGMCKFCEFKKGCWE